MENKDINFAKLVQQIELLFDKKYLTDIINNREAIKVFNELNEMQMSIYDILTSQDYCIWGFVINSVDSKTKSNITYSSYVIVKDADSILNQSNLQTKDLMQRIYKASLKNNHYFKVSEKDNNIADECEFFIDSVFEQARANKFGQKRLFDVFWGRDYKYLVGHIYRERDKYIFEYDKEGIQKSSQEGCNYLIGFRNINKRYESHKLFPVFSSRIPSPERHDINDILKQYGMPEYDEIELLAKTQGKLSTDNIEVKQVKENE